MVSPRRFYTHAFFLCFNLTIISYVSTSSDSVISMDYMDAFVNLSPQNSSESYDIISGIQLKNYEFQFDTRAGRRQVGVLGPEIENLLPDGTYVIPEHTVLSSNHNATTLSGKKKIRPKRIKLTNYYVVDKDSLFMHNIGATQEIILQLKEMMEIFNFTNTTLDLHQIALNEMSYYLKQESSAQLKEKRAIAENEVKQKELEIEKEKIHYEKENELVKLKGEMKMQLQKQFDENQQRRLLEETEKRKEHIDYLIKLYEETQIRIQLKTKEIDLEIERMQAEAAEKNARIQQNTSIHQTKLEIEGRIRQQRLNEDIENRQLNARYNAEKEKLLSAIQLIFDHLGNGFQILLSNKEKLLRFLGTIIAIALGIYGAREGTRIGGQVIEKYLGKPSLVRETSRKAGLGYFIKSLFWRSRKEDISQLSEVILKKKLETKIYELARSTKNSRKHGAPFRHLLLYGPPGTGKTMVAKRLARCSGLEYAIMSGGDVGPLGSDAVTELHAIFRWAKSSPYGVLLFIDEAEAFLGSRGKDSMSESMRNALNALLYQTGEQSYKFMMVLATNRPEDLDHAVADRVDETLHFDLPEEDERLQLLQMYFDYFIRYAHTDGTKPIPADQLWFYQRFYLGLKYAWKFFKGRNMTPITVKSDVNLKLFRFAAEKTINMSGREIAKLMLYMQSIIYGNDDDKVVNAALFRRVLQDKIDEHNRKKKIKIAAVSHK